MKPEDEVKLQKILEAHTESIRLLNEAVKTLTETVRILSEGGDRE